MQKILTTILLVLLGITLFAGSKKKSDKDYLQETQAGVAKRLIKDSAMVKTALEDLAISGAEKAKLYKKIEELIAKNKANPYPTNIEDAKKFRAIIPFNANHAKLFQIYSRTLRGRDYNGVKIWNYGRFDYFPLDVEPEGAVLKNLTLKMMRNEQRSVAFNLTNCTAQEQVIKITLAKIPQGAKAVLFHTVFVDTKKNMANPSALLKVAKVNQTWQFKLSSGMTTQVWLKIASNNIKAGEYKLPLTVSTAKEQRKLTFKLHIVPMDFPVKPRYSLHLFDYVSSGWAYAISSTNQQVAIDNLKAYLVKNFTIHPANIPGNSKKFYDKNGNMLKEPDPSSFIKAIKVLPLADHYILFLNLRHQGPNFIFAGFPAGSAAGNNAFKQWLAYLTKVVNQLGIEPQKFAIHIFDEPRENAHLHALYNALKIVKENSKFSTYCTISASGAKHEYCAKALKYLDIAQIFRPHFQELFGENREMFVNFGKKPGKLLWFYECGYKGDFKFYVASGWFDALAGAAGSGYWAYADTGYNPSNWNMYPNYVRNNYAAIYIDDNSVTSSREWEGIMESLENGEYVLLLRDKVKALKAAGQAVTKLEKLLKSRQPKNSKKSTELRLKILTALLTKVAPPQSNEQQAKTKKLKTVKIIKATASTDKKDAGLAIDGNFNTIWGTHHKNNWLQLELEKTSEVSSVAISWVRGGIRQAFFDIALSLDGKKWTPVITNGASTGLSSQLEAYSFKPQMAKYVRITFNGNSNSKSSGLYEVKVNFTTEQSKLDELKAKSVKIATLTASATAPDVSPEQANDDNMLTRWAVKGRNNWLQLELEATVEVNAIAIAWFKGDYRQTFFALQLSVDGKKWQTVIEDGSSSGKTYGFELYHFKAQQAKFARIIVYGNSANSWASIYEVKLYATSELPNLAKK